jgi:hypothetical protein
MLTFAVGATLANAGTLFSDLGTGGSVYTTGPGAIVQGASGDNIAQARPFTVAGSGLFDVTQFDLGVVEDEGFLNTFTASIWTDTSNRPGTELGSWNLSAIGPNGSCCLLATQTGIAGVTLTGGTEYFMVLAPVNENDGSKIEWENNSLGQNSAFLGALNGGAWINDSTGTEAAFDVLGDAAADPEPASILLLATGLAGLLAMLRRKSRPSN